MWERGHMKKILVYGIDEQRLGVISGIASNFCDEVHFVKNSELSERVIDILEKEADPKFSEQPLNELELCMFGGFDRESIFEFIDMMKETGIKRPVFATVTSNNLEWDFERVLVDVNQEHIEMQKMNATNAKK